MGDARANYFMQYVEMLQPLLTDPSLGSMLESLTGANFKTAEKESRMFPSFLKKCLESNWMQQKYEKLNMEVFLFKDGTTAKWDNSIIRGWSVLSGEFTKHIVLREYNRVVTKHWESGSKLAFIRKTDADTWVIGTRRSSNAGAAETVYWETTCKYNYPLPPGDESMWKSILAPQNVKPRITCNFVP